MTATTPTLHDVARLAGVSIATVSYVLNGRKSGNKSISDATRQKVLQAVSDLGYIPNQAARNLRRQSTERICVVLPQLGVPYYEVLCQAVQQTAEQYNYSVILALADSYEKERKILDQLARRMADGAIIVHGKATEEDLSHLAAAGISVVAFKNQISSQTFDVVHTNENEVFYQAMCYLLELGHRRIAFLSGATDQDGRFAAYQTALRDYAIPLDERLITRGAMSNRKEAYENASKLFQLSDRPNAVFAGSDVAAISTIWAAHDRGLYVPHDVAVIGAGNIPEGEIVSPPLTTIGPASLDFLAIGELMFSRLLTPELPGRTHLFPWKLIVRGSA